jgi:hypothetical protein
MPQSHGPPDHEQKPPKPRATKLSILQGDYLSCFVPVTDTQVASKTKWSHLRAFLSFLQTLS